MTLINPSTPETRFQMLSDLAENVGRRLEIKVKPYDVTSTSDASGAVHWMYRFDQFESRISRVQGGFQRFAEIELPKDGMIDLDDLSDQIRYALL